MNLCYNNKTDSTNYIYFYLFYTVLMEKLIDLLNEFEPRIASDGEHQDNIWLYRSKSEDKTVRNNAIRYLLSKEYKFIEWLITNWKIDNIKLLDLCGKDDCVVPMHFEDDKQKIKALILILSISDDPITDLISVFKENENN